MNPRVSPETKEIEQSFLLSTNEVTKYKYSEIPRQMFSCLMCESSSSEGNKFKERNTAFTKDVEKFFKQIDVINMLMAIKELKYMVNDIFAEIKRINQHRNNQSLQQENSEKSDQNVSEIKQSLNLELNQKVALDNQICDDDIFSKDFEKVR